MDTRLLSTALLCFGLLSQAHAGGTVRVANGDCAALDAALAANADGRTNIVLARDGYYECGIRVAGGDVAIDAQGALLESNVCPSTLVHVGSGAKLRIDNMHVVATVGCNILGFPPREVFNEGQLEINASTIEVPQILNHGPMLLRNVSWNGGLFNQNSLEVEQSTNWNGGIFNDTGAQLTLSNTLFSGDDGQTGCEVIGSGQVNTLGGNAVSASCAFGATTDLKWSSPPVLGALQDNGGLVKTRALPSNSLLRGKGIAEYCVATDARGEVRPAGTCDVGAYEVAGGSERVEAGGMNGFYFDRSADGHYVTIQRLHDEFVLVSWTTFDRDGRQAWIYGVGTAQGRTIHVAMSQNTGGRLQPGGPASGSHAIPWGVVDITLNGCSGGTFAYSSKLPAFGSGQFPLDRLASVADVGCVD